MRLEPLDGERVFLIHDLLSPEECDVLVARSEALGYEPPPAGREPLPPLRNNGLAFLNDAALAASLWERAAPFVPRYSNGRAVCGLHEQFRFYRYQAAQQFRVHKDSRVRRGEAEESQLTFSVYLTDVEEGGETNFYRAGGILEFEVRPRRGKALVFEHPRLHEGATVWRGRKYVLRTDVMYQREPTSLAGRGT